MPCTSCERRAARPARLRLWAASGLAALALAVVAGCGPVGPRDAGAGLTPDLEGLAATAGTWTWKDFLGQEGMQGTALLAGFRFVAGSPSQVVASFTGPEGWHGGQPVELPLAYPSRFYPHDQWEYVLLLDPPIGDPLDVTADAGNTVYHARVGPDAGGRLDPPDVDPPVVQPNQVTVRWTPVAGAGAYRVVLSDTRNMRSGVQLAEAFGTAAQATLVPSAALQPDRVYWVNVVAFPSELVLGATAQQTVDPPPDGFDVSSTEVLVELPAP
jgi:hypothetical protein